MTLKNTLSLLVGWFLFCLNIKAFNITFRVDMNAVTANYTTPQVNGTFNNWCGACFSMTDADGDNIWEGTTNLNAGSYQYKFTYDNWTGQEILTPGSPCTVTAGSFTNRSLTVTGDAVLPIVCWNSCASCADTPPPPSYYNVTFSLDMSEQSGFGIPEVNGSFNNWCGNCFQMTDSNNDSIYTATTTLLEGTYEFKFSYSNWLGQEILVPGSPCTQTTDIFTNRLLNLSSDTVLSPVCWGSCYGCGLEPQIYDVTFRVDMSEQSGYSIPEVNGTFNGWCGNCNPMSDVNNDSIWELTIPLTEGMMEYKFSFDNWSGQETLDSGSFCSVTSSGFTNRFLNLSNDTVLDLVCFGSCNVCGYTEPEPITYDVTFLVDMSQQSDFESVALTGSFNEFCGNCDLMFDSVGNGIWSVTVNLTEGPHYYLFATDSLSSVESFAASDACLSWLDSAYYRTVLISSDTILPLVCWNSCAQCPPPPALYNVTFQLDMSQQTGFSSAEINGSFNNYCGDCNPMLDSLGNGIWQTTLSLQAGNYTYFYSTDSLNTTEDLNSSDFCALEIENQFYRLLTVSADTILPIVCWSSCITCDSIIAPLDTFTVTFQLDMSNQSGFTLPEVNGSFNNFCGNCQTMSNPLGNGIWSISVAMAEGNYYYYYSADSLNNIENLNAGDACATELFDSNFFRIITVSADTILPVVCWSSCSLCPQPPATYNVTFRVDMSQQTGFTTPMISGTLNNWCGNCFPMSDPDGDNIWEASSEITAGSFEYKFTYDNYAGEEEFLEGGICTISNNGTINRYLNVVADTLLPVVCWSSCDACDTTPPPTAYSVTFRVDMSQQTGFTTPEVNGTFNNWCGNCFVMSDNDGDNIWEATTEVISGTYEYKFSHDNWMGSETLAEGSSCTVTNSGFTNRYLVLSSDTILPIVCWSSCTSCDSTPPPPMMRTVTFRLDMSQQSGFITPEVNGTFNNWCGNCFPMSDADGDNIWEATTTLVDGSYEYKYSFDNWSGSEQLTAGSNCTVTNSGFTNRILMLESDTTLNVVCWSSCATCDSTPPPPVMHTITFRVDMSQQSGFTTPEVNGTFNNWCGSCFPMSDADGDNIWEGTTSLATGDYEYKFSNDNWSGQESLTPGSFCTITAGAFTNRYLMLSSDTVLPIVCWGSCSACQEPQPVAVEFVVDVSSQTFNQHVSVAGSFNNFCEDCDTLTAQGNGVYSGVVNVLAGVYEYYFVLDYATSESLSDAPCTVLADSIFLRTVTVTEATTLPEVCWNSCDTCEFSTGVSMVNQIESTMYPNPADAIVYINMDEEGAVLEMLDITGSVVYSSVLTAGNNAVSTTKLSQGMYVMFVRKGSAVNRHLLEIIH